jgi:hypothetical protein
VGRVIQDIRSTPLALIAQAIGKVADKAKELLGLNTQPEYQGLVGKPLSFVVSGDTHRLWVVNRNGQSVIMRASTAASLDLSRDLVDVSAAERARVQGDADKATALGNQLNTLLRTAKAAADAKRPVDPGLAGQAQSLDSQLKTAEEVLEKDLIDDGAICFGNACFAAGTPLRTPGGWRAIEALRPGDRVLSRSENEPHGVVEAKAVEEVFVRLGSVWELRVGGQVVGTTGEHPFYAWERGWVACRELRVGDSVLCEDGSWRAVEGARDTGNWRRVYNLRVADHHTYFVGTEEWGFSVWAHNSYRDLSPQQLDQVSTQLEAKAADMLHLLLTEESNSVRSITVNGKVLRTFDDTPTNGGRGPALAVVEDLKTGKVYYGQNQGKVVENLHPLLRRRLDAFLARPGNAYLRGPRVLPYPGLPGSHAEFDAVNQALNSRGPGATEADLADLVMVVIRSQNFSTGKLFDPFVRCVVCMPGTQGVHSFTDPNS